MAKVEYPKMIYKGGESKIIRSAEEHAEHGDWKESPSEVEAEPEQAEAAPAKPKRSGKSKPVAE